MTAHYYAGGFYGVTAAEIELSENFECEGWRDLYITKNWCPLEVNIERKAIWISPDGKYYDGEAHENRAEEIIEIMYGETDVSWFGDRLEELGWIRAEANLMWEVRTDNGYWDNKKIAQKQYDALFDWCNYHNMSFLHDMIIF